MTPAESKDGPVSYTRVHRPDLAKVGKALQGMILDEMCFVTAGRFTAYWKKHPDGNISTMQYDPNRKLFVLSHHVDGKITMTPKQIFTVLDKKTELLLAEEPELLSEELRLFLEEFGNRIKNLLEDLNEK